MRSVVFPSLFVCLTQTVGAQASTAAHPAVGLMETAALLMKSDRVEEAFAKMEQQVAVDPMLAYELLFFFLLGLRC